MNLSLFISNKHLAEIEHSINDSHGKLVIKNKFNQDKPVIDIRKFTTGIYFIKIPDGDGIRFEVMSR